MSDISIFDLANLASTSLAAYGSLDSDQLKTSLTNEDTGADFTSTQADAFVARYELVDQRPNQLGGFSAALFWDKIDQKHVLAIRGTEMNLAACGVPVELLRVDYYG